MSTLLFLIFFPLLIALLLLLIKGDLFRDIVVIGGAVVIAAASLLLGAMYFHTGGEVFAAQETQVGSLMMAIEIVLAGVIVFLSVKHKKYPPAIFALIQTPLFVWFEITHGHHIKVVSNLYIDRLSLIMVLIIGIVGSLICVYSLGYMKDFRQHHEGQKDRRPWFFFLMFLFLSAMFGLVVSNNLVWMYFFWEITTLCSFFLIGFTKTKEAVNNSFRALTMNLLGGIGFVLAILVLGIYYDTLELSTVLMYGQMGYSVVVPVALLVFAGITKAAQMPFSSWLLGAMVAPTPTSALLHSSTMVKAGVFLIIKLSPVLGWNGAGIMAMMVGGVTFLMASFAAISQSNAKRVLAYSTVANLGLIIACAGIGTNETVWAAIMLVIFHAITKSLLFLCVGTAEHSLDSRDIEDMDGLFSKMPRLALFMMVGISGMFLAPLGMLVSKWAAMTAFVDSGNIPLVVIICFGSAATAFYWTKWLGKMAAIMAKAKNLEAHVHQSEWFTFYCLVYMVIMMCLLFPAVSTYAVVPYLQTIFRSVEALALSSSNLQIMSGMVALIILLPVLFFNKRHFRKKKIVSMYLSGVNTGDSTKFYGSMGNEVELSLRNWYVESIFGEARMTLIGNILSILTIVSVLGIMAGGVL
jgi:ech hydrogenase subunit A